MKKVMKIILICIVLIFPIRGLGQTILEGRVLQQDSVPVELANVLVKNTLDSVLVAGGITNAHGIFQISIDKSMPLDKLLIEISSIGYYKSYISIPISGQIGDIYIKENVSTLGEVEVLAQGKPKVRIMTGGINISLARTPLSNIGSALDLLSQLPMLHSSGRNLQVLGHGIPTVYINGRLISDISELQKLSSRDISSVRIITSPGSRYKVSTKSVLEIKTRTNLSNGIGGRLFGEIDKHRKITSTQFASLTYRNKSWEVNGNLSYKNGGMEETYDSFTSYPDEQQFTVENSTTIHKKYTNLAGSLGINFTSPLVSYGIKYDVRSTPRWRSDADIYYKATDGNIKREKSLSSNFEEQTTQHFVNAYTLIELSKKNSIRYDMDYVYKHTENSYLVNKTQSLSNSSSYFISGKLQDIIQLGNGDLTVGVDGVYTRNKQRFTTQIASLTDKQDSFESYTLASFVDFNGSFLDNKLGLEIGLRCEHTNETHKDPQSTEKKDLRESVLVPNVALSYSGWADWSLSYNSRVSRPSYRMLRNSIQYNDEFSYETGNLDLKATRNNTLDLKASKKNIILGVSYSQILNAFYIGQEFFDVSRNISIYKPRNTDMRELSLYGSYHCSPFSFWTSNIELRYNQPYLKIKEEKYNNPEFYISVKNTFSLPWNISLWVNLAYNLGGHSMIDLSNNYWKADIRLNKYFLNKTLSISITGRDIFRTYNHREETKINRFITKTFNNLDTQAFIIAVNYFFNSPKSRYKRGETTTEINRI